MTDRELLELAAKAAGIDGEWVRDTAYMQERYYFNVPYDNHNMLTGFRWDPLLDDGDALRLAVQLNISLTMKPRGCVASDLYISGAEAYEPFGKNRAADTRRAIVRAAAEMEKALK